VAGIFNTSAASHGDVPDEPQQYHGVPISFKVTRDFYAE
jgi:hypothetical protein